MFSMPVSTKRDLPTWVEVIDHPAKIDWWRFTTDEIYTMLDDVEHRGTVYNRRYRIAVYKAVRAAGRKDIATAYIKRLGNPHLIAIRSQLSGKRIADLAAYSALYIAVVMGVMSLLGATHSLNEYLAVGAAYFVGRLLVRVIFATRYEDNAD